MQLHTVGADELPAASARSGVVDAPTILAAKTCITFANEG
jgi:hypothetical protein